MQQEFGSTQGYDGSNLIKTSVSQGKDIIYVQMNYRLSVRYVLSEVATWTNKNLLRASASCPAKRS